MLNFKDKRLEMEELGGPFSKLVPYLLPLSEDKILCKDGSVLCSFEVEGLDNIGFDNYEIINRYKILDKAYRTIADEKIMVWWTKKKTKITDYPQAKFDDPISGLANTEYMNNLKRRNIYSEKLWITILIRPQIGGDRITETYARCINDGKSMIESIKITGKQILDAKSRGLSDLTEIVQQMKSLDDYCASFIGSVNSFLKMKPLVGDDLSSFLYKVVNPTSTEQSRAAFVENAYLDEYLPSDSIDVNGDHLRFRGVNREKFVTVYTPKINPSDWPTESKAGDIEIFSRIDSEFMLTVALKMVSPVAGKKYASSVKDHHLTMQKNLKTLVKELVSGKQLDEEVNQERKLFANEIEQALKDMAYNPASAFTNITLSIFSDTFEESIDAKVKAVAIFTDLGMVAHKETLHMLPAWSAGMPGQWAQSLRWSFLFGGNLADYTPIISKKYGERYNQHLSYYYGTQQDCLNLYYDRFNNPFYFNFHRSDLPHLFVLGPSRSGKSVFNLLNITLWSKYANSQTIIFDKDYTCQINTVIRGGKHLDPQSDFKINPFDNMKSDEDWRWGLSFITKLLESRYPELTPRQNKELEDSVNLFREYNGPKRLLTLAGFLPEDLKERLSKWIGAGKYGNYFDNEEDSFKLSKHIAIEMGNVMKEDEAGYLFMDYCFWRINKSLDGKSPTLIYIEEAWFLLKESKFAQELDNWLRTLAKKEAFVVLATQSLAELADSESFTAIIDNIPNKIFLPNANVMAHQELYQNKLSLLPSIIELIKNAIPKQEYIYVSTSGNGALVKILNAPIPKKTLAIMRSDSKARTIFEQWRKSGKSDWRTQYVEDMARQT